MADLTEREYFHKFRSVKTLPLARLQAREDHVEAFKALAHLTRLQIFFFLVREGREVPAGEIQTELEVPGPTLSHHLDVLRRAGQDVEMVRQRRPGDLELGLDLAGRHLAPLAYQEEEDLQPREVRERFERLDVVLARLESGER